MLRSAVRNGTKILHLTEFKYIIMKIYNNHKKYFLLVTELHMVKTEKYVTRVTELDHRGTWGSHAPHRLSKRFSSLRRRKNTLLGNPPGRSSGSQQKLRC